MSLDRHRSIARRYSALPSPRAITAEAGRFALHPAAFPYDLERRPELAGEKTVFDALSSALGAEAHIFYNRTVKGSRRRFDFLVLLPLRGLIVIEVKGGLVHAGRGAFRQVIQAGRGGHRKRIEPFGQARLALEQLWTKTGLSPVAIPTFIMAAFPRMSETAYLWGTAVHILTREDIEDAARLRQRLTDALPASPAAIEALDDLAELLISNAPCPRIPAKKPQNRNT